MRSPRQPTVIRSKVIVHYHWGVFGVTRHKNTKERRVFVPPVAEVRIAFGHLRKKTTPTLAKD